jgi:hypothetical protein
LQEDIEGQSIFPGGEKSSFPFFANTASS